MAAPLWFPIAFRTAHDRIGVAPLRSLRFGSEELRISAACDCGDVQRRGLFCAGPDSSAADCDDASTLSGETRRELQGIPSCILYLNMLVVSTSSSSSCLVFFDIHRL
jgi:hypothetical protein